MIELKNRAEFERCQKVSADIENLSSLRSLGVLVGLKRS